MDPKAVCANRSFRSGQAGPNGDLVGGDHAARQAEHEAVVVGSAAAHVVAAGGEADGVEAVDGAAVSAQHLALGAGLQAADDVEPHEGEAGGIEGALGKGQLFTAFRRAFGFADLVDVCVGGRSRAELKNVLAGFAVLAALAKFWEAAVGPA